MKRNSIKIEILPWMSFVYDLKGLDLIVYALIYSETELSINKLGEILRIPRDEIWKSITKLRNEKLIVPVFIHKDERQQFYENGAITIDELDGQGNSGITKTYVVNEDMLI